MLHLARSFGGIFCTPRLAGAWRTARVSVATGTGTFGNPYKMTLSLSLSIRKSVPSGDGALRRFHRSDNNGSLDSEDGFGENCHIQACCRLAKDGRGAPAGTFDWDEVKRLGDSFDEGRYFLDIGTSNYYEGCDDSGKYAFMFKFQRTMGHGPGVQEGRRW